jgi:Beta-lactamase enzyme family
MDEFVPWYEQNWQIGYSIVRSNDRASVSERNLDTIFEASSTIKLVVLRLFLQSMTSEKHDLDSRFKITEEHKSNGSGIVNWTDWRDIDLYNLIHLTCVYSDCVTTNIMIDSLGGMSSVNTMFDKLGLHSTRLNMYPINFDLDKPGIQSVAGTTPFDSANWLSDLLDDKQIRRSFRGVVRNSLRCILEPWFNPYKLRAGYRRSNLIFKTGSMLDTDVAGMSVLNIVGRYKNYDTWYDFSFFSCGDLINNRNRKKISPDLIQKFVADYICSVVLKNPYSEYLAPRQQKSS